MPSAFARAIRGAATAARTVRRRRRDVGILQVVTTIRIHRRAQRRRHPDGADGARRSHSRGSLLIRTKRASCYARNEQV